MTAVISHGKFKSFFFVSIIYTKGIEKRGLTGKGEEQTNEFYQRKTDTAQI